MLILSVHHQHQPPMPSLKDLNHLANKFGSPTPTHTSLAHLTLLLSMARRQETGSPVSSGLHLPSSLIYSPTPSQTCHYPTIPSIAASIIPALHQERLQRRWMHTWLQHQDPKKGTALAKGRVGVKPRGLFFPHPTGLIFPSQGGFPFVSFPVPQSRYHSSMLHEFIRLSAWDVGGCESWFHAR